VERSCDQKIKRERGARKITTTAAIAAANITKCIVERIETRLTKERQGSPSN
jgi:hypothetical protein